MKRINAVRDKIFAAADSLRSRSIVPTTINIRASIGGGSQTTIHKYLVEWRELYDCEADFSPKQMQRQLEEQRKINENLTLELLNSSTLMAHERDENTKLRARILELETRLEEKVLSSHELANRNAASEVILKSAFDSSVLLLSEQLRAINAQAITKVQEVGQHFDEQAMALKLELRSLKEQLSQKDKELKKLNAQLSTVSVESKYGV